MATNNKSIEDNNSNNMTNQNVVPDLIKQLYNAKIEEVTNSNGTVEQHIRDPHLRLRRTLTPSLNIGMSKYNESQFIIHPTTGKRETIKFDALGETFNMDTYSWGASESDAKIRMFGLHGISPAVSRIQWHPLGDEIEKDASLCKKVRFVAIDWHSIDRTDKYQTEFLTLLPKHIFDVIPKEQQDAFAYQYRNEKDRTSIIKLMEDSRINCPRRYEDGVAILNAIITQGLRWGRDKPYIPCVKSWSGGILMELLHESVSTKKEEYKDFRESIVGAVMMHPGYFLKPKEDIQLALRGIPSVLMCWATDDDLVPYDAYSGRYLNDNVELVTYKIGKHGSFNGSIPDHPNFNIEIMKWLMRKFDEKK
jgi:hypothetical protein